MQNKYVYDSRTIKNEIGINIIDNALRLISIGLSIMDNVLCLLLTSPDLKLFIVIIFSHISLYNKHNKLLFIHSSGICIKCSQLSIILLKIELILKIIVLDCIMKMY